MALSRSKYRRLPDLYVTGDTIVLKDGSTMWVQVLNPFEKDEAAHDAQLARARLTLSMKGGDERDKVAGAMARDGREATLEKMVESLVGDNMNKVVEGLQNDPEWTERIEIMDRGDDIIASDEQAERDLLTRINEEYLTEFNRQQNEERDFQRLRLNQVSDEDLLEEYVEMWLEKRGTEVARAEYQLTELWYAARVCDAKAIEGATGSEAWDHEPCENHRLTVFETKQECRHLPEDLQVLITATVLRLNMSERDARFSDRQGSSSDSSPLPSSEAESTPSTPTETLAGAPGT